MKKNDISTKKCKYCKSEIDKEAKICTICKQKQGNKIVNGIVKYLVIWLVLSGLIMGGLYAISNLFNQDTKVDKNKIYEMNERIEFKDSAITVLSYTTRERESDIWSAGDGNEFYIITIKFENLSSSEKGFYSSNFKLIDSNGETYSREDFVKHEEMGSITLQANGTATKDIRFAIPKGMEKVTLKYDNGLFGSTVKIKIK